MMSDVDGKYSKYRCDDSTRRVIITRDIIQTIKNKATLAVFTKEYLFPKRSTVAQDAEDLRDTEDIEDNHIVRTSTKAEKYTYHLFPYLDPKKAKERDDAGEGKVKPWRWKCSTLKTEDARENMKDRFTWLLNKAYGFTPEGDQPPTLTPYKSAGKQFEPMMQILSEVIKINENERDGDAMKEDGLDHVTQLSFDVEQLKLDQQEMSERIKNGQQQMSERISALETSDHNPNPKKRAKPHEDNMELTTDEENFADESSCNDNDCSSDDGAEKEKQSFYREQLRAQFPTANLHYTESDEGFTVQVDHKEFFEVKSVNIQESLFERNAKPIAKAKAKADAYVKLQRELETFYGIPHETPDFDVPCSLFSVPKKLRSAPDAKRRVIDLLRQMESSPISPPKVSEHPDREHASSGKEKVFNMIKSASSAVTDCGLEGAGKVISSFASGVATRKGHEMYLSVTATRTLYTAQASTEEDAIKEVLRQTLVTVQANSLDQMEFDPPSP
jgi:hypothetical protein